jgi:hypothetical protein
MIASMEANEFKETFEPVILGVIKLPSINCIKPKIVITPAAYQ